MSGITKRKHNAELMRFNKQLKQSLNKIYDILPCKYDENIILEYFKKFYPTEYKTIEQRYRHYQAKDEFLVNHGKKRRYKHLSPKKYLFTLAKVKHLQNCDEKEQLEKLRSFQQKRETIINNRKEKISKNKRLLQTIEPMFIDVLINFYHKKGNGVFEKMEIVKELQKYDSEKVIEFFSKLNDSERNYQIRILAFNHLQRLGYYVKLRKGFKGKKKTYMFDKTTFEVTPQDLFDRLEDKYEVQEKKQYDFFISHSYKDVDEVVKVKDILNQQGYLIYCDWMSDQEFLKRELASEFTWYVLQQRIKQSKKVIFVLTQNSINKSDWIQKELDFAKSIGKEIVYLDLIDNRLLDNYIKSELKETV